MGVYDPRQPLSDTGPILIGQGFFTLSGGPALVYSQIADSTTISNTIAETAYSKTISLPANLLQIGTLIRTTCLAVLSSDAGGCTFLWKTRIGGTAFHTGIATASQVSQTNMPMSFASHGIVRTLGAGGTLQPGYGFGRGPNNAGTDQIGPDQTLGASTIAVNTTVALTVDVTVTMGTATAGNTTTLKMFTVEILAPGTTS